MAKNVRDEENADRWQGSFASIQQALDELRTRGAAPQPLPEEIPQGTNSEPLLKQAEQALQQGLYYPAVLAGAVAFEQTVRQKFERAGRNPRYSLGALLDLLRSGLNEPQYAETLGALLRLRNGLVHAEPALTNPDRAQATSMLEAFRDAVNRIESLDLPISASVSGVHGRRSLLQMP